MSTLDPNTTPVSAVALGLKQFPVLGTNDFLKTALEEMTEKGLGIVCVVDGEGLLKGVFTDGDIRRHLLSVQRPFAAFFSDDVIDHASKAPTVVAPKTTLVEALAVMGEQQIWDLPVVDVEGRLTGLLHLHPLVSALVDESVL